MTQEAQQVDGYGNVTDAEAEELAEFLELMENHRAEQPRIPIRHRTEHERRQYLGTLFKRAGITNSRITFQVNMIDIADKMLSYSSNHEAEVLNAMHSFDVRLFLDAFSLDEVVERWQDNELCIRCATQLQPEEYYNSTCTQCEAAWDERDAPPFEPDDASTNLSAFIRNDD